MPMEGESIEKKASPAAKSAAVDATSQAVVGSNGVAPRRGITPEERTAALRFIEAAHEDAMRYMAMSEDEVEDEYRRAGKLHRYDPDKEWQKRYARVARAYPPPRHLFPKLDEFTKYLEEDEADEAPPSAAGN